MKSILTLFFFVAIGYGCQFASHQIQDETVSLLLKEAVKATQEHHLQPKTIDNTLSKQVFDFYLKQIDSDKEFLTQKDISLLEEYENKIDEELTNGTFDFLNRALVQLEKGIQKAEKYSQAAVSDAHLNLVVGEQLETNSEKLAYAANNAELKERWLKKVKHLVLEELWVSEKQTTGLSFAEQKQAIRLRLDSVDSQSLWFSSSGFFKACNI